MILHTFGAETFRNIPSASLTFGPGVHLLLGNNAQGKTNVIEGIYMFAGGRSFRGTADKDLVMMGERGFSLHIGYEDVKGQNTMDYRYYDGARKKFRNEAPVKRMSDIMGNFRAVLFTPDHLKLVKESPEERRNFLNIGISQCYPVYVKIYADYKRAMEERNCLLRQAQKGNPVDLSELSAWSVSVAGYASHIYGFRKKYAEKIHTYAARMLSDMSDGKEELFVRYKNDIREDSDDREKIEEQYKEILSENIVRECAAGSTLFGPVRDDLDITINGISVRQFASQGQQRSTVLALKYAEGEVCRDFSGEYPVYLLDDVMSELDEKRREFLFYGIKGKQVIMTACNKDNAAGHVEHVIRVEGGRYVSSYRER